MSPEENKKIVLGFIEELKRGDVEAAFSALAEDVRWWLPGTLPNSGTYVGKQEIIEGLFGHAADVMVPDSMTMEVSNIIAEGNFVSVEWITRLDLLNGGKYENFYHPMFEVRDGKIQELREYVDTQYMKEKFFD